MLNKVLLIGNLTRDVELRYSTGGSAISKLGLAANRRWKDKNTGETKDEAMFIDVTVFGRSAEIANQYLKKGSKVLVEGRIQLERWVDANGQNRSKHGIVAENLQFLDSKDSNSGGDSSNYSNYNNQPQQNSYDDNSYGGGNSYQQAPKQNNYKQPSSSPSMPSAPIEDDEIPF